MRQIGQWLFRLLYSMAWLSFRPINAYIRYRAAPAPLVGEMALDPARPVVYVLATRDWTDLFVLERICRDMGLPSPSRTGRHVPDIDRTGVLYMPVLLEERRKASSLSTLIETAAGMPEFDAQVIPVSIFWGRDPGSETSWFRLLFSDSVQAGRLRKLLIMFANGRNVLANFGRPIAFREYFDAAPTPALGQRKLTRALHFHFLRARTAALGPSLLPRRVVIDDLLQRPGVLSAIDDATRNGKLTRSAAMTRARRYANEIAADYSTITLRILDKVLGGIVFKRVFRAIETQGLSRVRDWAQDHEIIYMPCHRSHADYLLVSYTLYHAGLVPPHIAAGVNLNFWPAGAILRRAGAFYMRRSFSGDRIYSSVFRAYVDALIRRGYPIEFFPEGGRSRTGRLLPPKTGLLSMVVEASLRQRARKVAVVPVYIGYDRVWEVGSYAKELRGATKRKESAEGLLKAGTILSRQYGKAYINFGEPFRLQDAADAALPGWREIMTPDGSEKPVGFNKFVQQLGLENARRINAGAVANANGLAAVALLAAPQRAVSRDEFIEQIGHLIWLIKGVPVGPDQLVPETSPTAVLEWAVPIAGIAQVKHRWGDIYGVTGKAAVAMTYNRNNIQHLLAMPGLIANLFRTRGAMPEDSVLSSVQALYPFLRNEFFLPWPVDGIDAITRQTIAVLVQLGLLSRDPEDATWLVRPSVAQPAFSTLSMLGRVMGETLERYCITTLLLATEAKRELPVSRAAIEEHSRLLAERMALLTGRDAPEFFDSTLFRGYLTTLISVGLLTSEGDEGLRISPDIHATAERALEFLSDDARQTLAQLLSRRRPETAGSAASAETV